MDGNEPTQHPKSDQDYVPFQDDIDSDIANAPTAPPAPAQPNTRMAGGDDPTIPAPASQKPITKPRDPGNVEQDRPTATQIHRPGESMVAPTGDAMIGRRLGGLVVKQQLGAGGMGAVYLARQISLDRDVAVKVLPENLALNPDFVARFTREALTAAQLSHHNVVHVHDVGSEHLVNYIVMEYVRGDNLGSMTRKGGKLALEDAAAFVLQAARGLAYAHERGIIHRDIKPDNLMVNEHGVVKVADMGLAKIKGDVERSIGLDAGAAEELKRLAYGELTGASVAMGTPAYMAPEQGRDASKADHRADQYSLGCTLYYLLAGQTPYTGKTSFEIISKHITEPLVPVERIVANVPHELSAIIQRMMAKAPEDRFESLHQVVQALESFLGLDAQKGPYTPREHHVKLLEQKTAEYYSVPALKMAAMAKAGYFFGSLALFLLGLFVSGFLAAAGLGLLILTPLFNFIVGGVITREYIFRRVRSVFFGMGMKGWGNAVLWGALTLVTLYVFGLLFAWIAVTVVALVAVLAYQFGVRGKIRSQRAAPVAAIEEILKKLRINGVSEDLIMHFVSQYSGKHWEELFEQLFGYEAMIRERARLQRTDTRNPRKRHASWRDPLARWLDETEEKRRKRHEEKVLAKAEKQRLKAEGATEQEAEKQADEIAAQAMSEGLLKDTMMLPAAPSRSEVEKVGLELHQSTGGRGKLIGVGYRLVRALVGLVMFVAALPVLKGMLPIPPIIESIFSPYYALGEIRFLQYSGIAGLLLLFTAASKRVIFPTIVFLGALAFAFMKLVVGFSDQPDLLVFWTASGLVLGGFVMMVLAKIGGGKF